MLKKEGLACAQLTLVLTRKGLAMRSRRRLVCSSSFAIKHRSPLRIRMWMQLAAIAGGLLTTQLRAGSFFFSTGDPDGKMATASRLPGAGKIEIESADDFITTDFIKLNSATFTGLLIGGASLADIADVGVEFY